VQILPVQQEFLSKYHDLGVQLVMQQGIVISLGSVNADFQVRVDRRPDLSETLMAHDFAQLSGGKAANVAYLTCKLGRLHR